MQGLVPIDSGSYIPQSRGAIEVPPEGQSLYITLQQEVDLGVQALQRDTRIWRSRYFKARCKN